MGADDFQTPKELRDAYDALDKAQTQTLTELDSLKQDNRLLTAKDAFREADYDPAHAKLYVASVDGDITEDSIKEFVTTYNLQPVTIPAAVSPSTEGEGDQQNVPADDTDLSLMAGASTQSGDGGQPTVDSKSGHMTVAEWEVLAVEDPAAARQAVTDNKVLLRKDNFYVRNPRH